MNRGDAPLSESDDQGAATNAVQRRKPGRIRVWMRRFVMACGWTSIIVAAFILSPLPNVIYASMDWQDPLAKADVIICLGGNSNRVIESARLLNDGYAPTLIVSNLGSAARLMREQAIEWGAPADRVLVDDQSARTLDHPAGVAKAGGIDIAHDACIIVTSYTHLARARAVFEKGGYRHIIMREPRWERQTRDPNGLNWRGRLILFPKLLYEGAGWLSYWVRGVV